jgi:D-alanyl-D-alanine carboxypeptidase/D-alanyl-D-alanine-endopeptidase (penicillin-binding protein 4)
VGRRRRALAALAFGLACATVALANRDAVNAAVDEALGKSDKRVRVGLVVRAVSDGDTWVSRLPNQPLKPASVLKLLTTAAALERFGPEFAFRTELYLHEGDLWIRGGGDPALGDVRVAKRLDREPEHLFDEWAAALKARGTTRVGKLILDDTIYEPLWRHPDWPDDQADRWYQAPVGGLNYNDNCLDIAVRIRDRQVTLELTPELPLTFVDSTLRYGSKQRPLLRRPIDSDVFRLSGTVRQGGSLPPTAVRRPTVFFGHALRAALAERGIEVSGGVFRGSLADARIPDRARVTTHATELPDVLWRCNRYSQNMFAESLLKSLAAYHPDGRRRDQPGTWESGAAELRTTLTRLGVPLEGCVIRDGSGLSHSNRVTANTVVTLLRKMHTHRQAALYRATLARPGESGSMRRRYNNPALHGRVWAKTGTINQVRALAGYVQRDDGTLLAFALLANGPVDAELPEKICQALLAGD